MSYLTIVVFLFLAAAAHVGGQLTAAKLMGIRVKKVTIGWGIPLFKIIGRSMQIIFKPIPFPGAIECNRIDLGRSPVRVESILRISGMAANLLLAAVPIACSPRLAALLQIHMRSIAAMLGTVNLKTVEAVSSAFAYERSIESGFAAVWDPWILFILMNLMVAVFSLLPTSTSDGGRFVYGALLGAVSRAGIRQSTVEVINAALVIMLVLLLLASLFDTGLDRVLSSIHLSPGIVLLCIVSLIWSLQIIKPRLKER